MHMPSFRKTTAAALSALPAAQLFRTHSWSAHIPRTAWPTVYLSMQQQRPGTTLCAHTSTRKAACSSDTVCLGKLFGFSLTPSVIGNHESKPVNFCWINVQHTTQSCYLSAADDLMQKCKT